MATPAYTKTEIGHLAYAHVWTLTTADHTGAILELPGAADRSVQFDDGHSGGAWGSATAVWEGSNDGDTFHTLLDPQGNAISKTADALEAVLENVRYMRPRLSTVGSGASVRVTLVSHGNT